MRIHRGQSPGSFSTHTEYKAHLRPLFRGRCAYCLTPDDRLGGMESMTVDHFWPRDRYPDLLLSWENLYYSCGVCNEHYKKNHPSEREEAAGFRFVDPCQDDPDEHFRLIVDPRTGERCVVRPLSPAAEYSSRILRLNSRPFLRDFWRELDSFRSRLEKRRAEIDILLNCVQAKMTSRSESLNLESLHIDLLDQREECLRELQAVFAQRPFPVE
jgi:uncharacterized protein (TIGR02646 family)